MSVLGSPALSFRSDDRALHTLFPGINNPDEDNGSFEEFFHANLTTPPSPDASDEHLHDRLTSFLDPVLPNHGQHSRGHDATDTMPEQKSPQPWREGLWSLASESPSRRRADESRNMNFTHAAAGHFGRRDADREVTLSPTPVYAQLPNLNHKPLDETWQDDLRNLHLRSSPERRTPRRPQHGERLQYVIPLEANRIAITKHANIGLAITTDAHHGHQQYRAHYGSPIDLRLIDPNLHGCRPNPNVRNYPRHDVHAAETSRSVDHSSHSQESCSDTSGELLADQTRHGTSSAISAQPNHHRHNFSRHYGYAVIPPPYPAPYVLLPEQHHLTGHRINPHHSELDAVWRSGLPILPHQTMATHVPTPIMHDQVFTNSPTSEWPVLPMTPLPTPPLTHLNSGLPFDTIDNPSLTLCQPAYSPSPSTSPKSRKRTSLQSENLVTQQRSRSQTRRKSTHIRGVTKDPDYVETRVRARSQTHTRSSNRARSASRPRVSKTSPSKTARVSTSNLDNTGFVNFTVHDSEKILSDVAPSGSSKTRARREQEEKEKRKRLSEAALKVVKRAGGDVAAFKKMISSH